MNLEKVKHQISTWDKNAREIEVIDTGDTSIVGLTNSAAYRFPKTADAESTQLFEAALYKDLSNALSIPTPQFIRTYDDPTCIVITRLQGSHLSIEELTSLQASDLQSIIHQLLEFSITLNKAITPDTVKKLEHTYISSNLYERSWNGYLSRHLKDAHFPEQQWLEELAHSQFEKWARVVNESVLPKIVVHDDLHNINFLFQGRRISGILDFGDCTVGTIAQELRQLYRISEVAVQTAIDDYLAMTGTPINPDEITTWAVTQELASYCRWYAASKHKHSSFKRAQANLRKWLSEFKG